MTTTIVPVTRDELALAEGLPLDRHPAVVYLSTLAPGSSRDTMRDALNHIAALLGTPEIRHSTGENLTYLGCNWSALRYQHTAAIRARLMTTYSAATANKLLAALRRVLKEARRLGQISGDEYTAATDIEAVKGEKPDAAAGRALTSDELKALLDICAADPSPAGARDTALIALNYTTGMRRGEIVNINLEDFDRSTLILTVRGKRNKTRSLPVEGSALDALKDWLVLRGVAAGPLFTRILKGGKLTLKRLTPQAVYHIETQRGVEAGVAKFSPHDLRRTFAGDLLDAGVDLATVKKLMGHADANTTAGYDRRGERAKREAVKKLRLPYSRRREGGTE